MSERYERTRNGGVRQMILHRWEIWHTYAAHLTSPPIDLEGAANVLVSSGFARCALLPDLSVVGLSEGELKKEGVNVAGDNLTATTKIEYPPWLDDYSRETVVTAALMRTRMRLLFGAELGFPAPHLTAAIGECRLQCGETTAHLYPMLKLFEDGVVLLSFRIVDPAEPIHHDHFVDHHLTLRLRTFDRTAVPPGVAKVVADAENLPGIRGVRRRNRQWGKSQVHHSYVEENTQNVRSGDFEFQHFWFDQDLLGYSESFRTLALSMLDGVAYLADRPGGGFRYVIGGRKRKHILGGYWSARPHIHLLAFKKQRDTASRNESSHLRALASILAGTRVTNKKFAKTILGRNLRPNNDYGAYINSGGSLWVHTGKSLAYHFDAGGPKKKPLFMASVVEHQVAADVLDYGHALHRQLAEDASAPCSDLDEVLTRKTVLVDLGQTQKEGAVFGELRDLLEAGWSAYGIPDLRHTINDHLQTAISTAEYKFSKRTSRWATALTILFGMGVVPVLSDRVLKPVGEVIEWPMDNVVWGSDAFFLGTAAFFVAAGLFLTWAAIRRA